VGQGLAPKLFGCLYSHSRIQKTASGDHAFQHLNSARNFSDFRSKAVGQCPNSQFGCFW